MVEESGNTVAFVYKKPDSVRAVHADGAWGVVTPNGNINLRFWNESGHLPSQLVFGVSQDGRLGQEIADQSHIPGGFLREIQTEVVLSHGSAKLLATWLVSVLKEAGMWEGA